MIAVSCFSTLTVPVMLNFLKIQFLISIWFICCSILQANPDFPPHSRLRKWKDISLAEMKQFMSLYILTGIIRKPELGVLDHQPVLEHQPIAEGVFFQQYYVAESSPTYSHFNGNSKYDPNDPQKDRLVQKPLGSCVPPLGCQEGFLGLGSQFSDMPETNIYEIKLRRHVCRY